MFCVRVGGCGDRNFTSVVGVFGENRITLEMSCLRTKKFLSKNVVAHSSPPFASLALSLSLVVNDRLFCMVARIPI